MQLMLSVSTYGGIPLPDVLRAMQKAGATQLELAVGVPPGNYLALLQQAPLTYRLHSNFPIGGRPRQLNPVADCALADWEQTFAFCQALRITEYTLHPGTYDSRQWTPVQAANRFWSNLVPIVELANRYQIRLGFETMYPMTGTTQWYLQNDLEILSYLLNGAALQLGLVADTAHLRLLLTQGLCTRQLAEAILHHPSVLEFHVSDNDGLRDNHVPATPSSWFWGCLRSALAAHPAPVVIAEGRVNRQGPSALRAQLDLVASQLA